MLTKILYGYNNNHTLHFSENSIEKPKRISQNHLNILKSFNEKLIPLNISHSETLRILKETHSEDFIEKVKNCYSDFEDVYINKDTYNILLENIGICLNRVDDLKDYHKRFLNLRPSSIHSTFDNRKRFCIFNNIVMLTKYRLEKGYKEVLICDFDIFHGDGVQSFFYDRKNVIYFSTHKCPGFPKNTGFMNELGVDQGLGFNHNFPIHETFDSSEYINVWENDFKSVTKYINPDLVLVSCGFNFLKGDFLTKTKNNIKDLEKIINIINDYTKDKDVVYFVEGGMKSENVINGSELIFKTI